MRLVLTILLLLAPVAGHAGIAPSALEGAYLDAKAATRLPLPLSLRFRDAQNRTVTLKSVIGDRPAVLVLADYTCTNLCGPIVAFAAGGLAKTGLAPGRDFHLVVIGIDPKDTLESANAMKASRIGTDTPLAKATILLRGTPETVKQLTTAAGYHYVYDQANDQYAHPAAAYVLTPDGHVAAVLSGLGLDGKSLRLALVQAGQGQVGGFVDQVRLLCYGFDPSKGLYTANIMRWLTAGAVATVAALAGGILFMSLKVRRRARS